MTKRSREDFETRASDSDTDDAGLSPEYPGSDSTRAQPSSYDSFSTKIVHLDPESREAIASSTKMLCSLPPHRESLQFASFEDYDAHYLKDHTNRCVECRRNFPSDHFLTLHIEENHDAFVSVRRERGERTVRAFIVLPC